MGVISGVLISSRSLGLIVLGEDVFADSTTSEGGCDFPLLLTERWRQGLGWEARRQLLEPSRAGTPDSPEAVRPHTLNRRDQR